MVLTFEEISHFLLPFYNTQREQNKILFRRKGLKGKKEAIDRLSLNLPGQTVLTPS